MDEAKGNAASLHVANDNRENNYYCLMTHEKYILVVVQQLLAIL